MFSTEIRTNVPILQKLIQKTKLEAEMYANLDFPFSPVPEFLDPVFTKTSPKRSFSIIENWVYKFGHRFQSFRIEVFMSSLTVSIFIIFASFNLF